MNLLKLFINLFYRFTFFVKYYIYYEKKLKKVCCPLYRIDFYLITAAGKSVLEIIFPKSRPIASSVQLRPMQTGSDAKNTEKIYCIY